MTRYVAPERDVGLQGHYAGICTRLVGFLFDLVVVVFVYTLLAAVINYLVSTLSGETFKISDVLSCPGRC